MAANKTRPQSTKTEIIKLTVNSIKKPHGFTLVELIIGMIVLAIVMTIITGLLAPQAKHSADPIIQIRASELGQAMMNEILAKSFDEYSDRSPPWLRCGETGTDVCSATLGPDCLDNTKTAPACTGSSLETRATFNDVDDYIGTWSGSAILDSLGTGTGNYYTGYELTVTVIYDSDHDDTTINTNINATAKLITVSVTSSTNEVYGFSAYKGNY